MSRETVAQAGRWPVAFVAISLLALALFPALQGRRIAMKNPLEK